MTRESDREKLATRLGELLAEMQRTRANAALGYAALYTALSFHLGVTGDLDSRGWRDALLAVMDRDPRLVALEHENADLRVAVKYLEDRLFEGTVSYCMQRDLAVVQETISATTARSVTTPQRIRCTDTGYLYELGDTGAWYQLPATELLSAMKELFEAREQLRHQQEVCKGHAADLARIQAELADRPTADHVERVEEWAAQVDQDHQGLVAEHVMCPDGCGCRLLTDDGDRRECGCNGMCSASLATLAEAYDAHLRPAE